MRFKDSHGFMVFLSAILVLSCPQKSLSGGTDVGNGGSLPAQEFIATALKISEMLNETPESIVSTKFKADFKNLILNVTVLATDRLFLNGEEVSAINYPAKHLIKVSLPRWNQIYYLQERVPLVLHEYLGLMGLNDYNYQMTNQIIPYLNSAMAGKNNIINRKLTQSLCAGIAIRDLQTVGLALKMGANINSDCGDIAREIESCQGTEPGTLTKYSPVSLAFKMLGRDTLCSEADFTSVENDLQMSEILYLILKHQIRQKTGVIDEHNL